MLFHGAATERPRSGATADLVVGVGRTPLITLDFTAQLPRGVRIFAKLESVNPGGSIKDRPVARIIRHALRDGQLPAGRRLLDSSSGNAGIAYAMFGAAFGVGITLVIPGNASAERLDRIRAHGAQIILTDPLEGYDFALREAQRLASEHPERYWYANQYANENNWRAHYETTGVEIHDQVRAASGAAPDAFVAGVGTGGTLTGVGRRLKQANPEIHIVTIVPERFPGIEGLKPLGLPEDIVPEILDETIIDERIDVTLDDGLDMASALARQGLFVGPSSGAYVHAALEVASTHRFHSVVTVLNDTGERYTSTGMWGDMAEDLRPRER